MRWKQVNKLYVFILKKKEKLIDYVNGQGIGKGN